MLLISLKSCNRVENNAMIGETINFRQKEDGMLAQNLFYHVKTIVHKLRPEKTSCKVYEAPDDYAQCIEKGMIKRFENFVILFLCNYFIFSKQLE